MAGTVIIADEIYNNRLILAYSLMEMDFEILQAECMEDALLYFDGRKIDLLITSDILRDGRLNVLPAQVRNMEEYGQLPIFLMTTPESTGWTFFEHDATIYLIEKPIRPVKLLDEIREKLKITV